MNEITFVIIFNYLTCILAQLSPIKNQSGDVRLLSTLFECAVPSAMLNPPLLPLPAGTGETPSLGTLDSYLSRMGSMLETNPQEHRALVVQLQDILAHLDR